MPLLLLHGSADTPRCWSGVIANLDPSIDVSAPALPPAPADGGSALEHDLEWLHEQVQALGGAVDLVGHSYGALLGLRYALDRPGVVRRLGLCEPIAFNLLSGTPAKDGIDALNRSFFGRLDTDPEAALAGLVDYWNGPGAFAAVSATARGRLLDSLARTASEVASGRDDRTTAQELLSLGIPCFVLAGERTTVESRAVCQAIADAVSAPSRIVRGAGHQAPRTHPGDVGEAIAALLRR
jgi:pimeloyl-ACP methyl ester carboxylesterase